MGFVLLDDTRLLGLHHGAVGAAWGVPCSAKLSFLERVLGGQFLVYVDAESWLIVAPHVAVANFRATGEDFLGAVLEDCVLLNTEVPGVEVKMQIRGVTDW